MVHANKKVLLIDDSEIDLFIQKRFLEVFDFSKELLTYSSASEALEWLKTTDDTNIPDIIFLDLNMPIIDGFGFLLNFSSLPDKIKDKTRVVILTSSNSSQDKDKALTFNNVIHYMTKPMKQSDLEVLKLKLAS